MERRPDGFDALGARTPRRRFLGLLAAGVAALRRRGALFAGVASVAGATKERPAVPAGYVAPSYLPAGFKLAGEFVNRPDGFGAHPREIALWFRNETHPSGWNAPIVIFEHPSAVGPLGATEGRAGEVIDLRLADGVVRATYHDGMWQPAPAGGLEWAAGAVRSLTFAYRGLRIGVRGSSVTGVTRATLVRVAQSLT